MTTLLLVLVFFGEAFAAPLGQGLYEYEFAYPGTTTDVLKVLVFDEPLLLGEAGAEWPARTMADDNLNPDAITPSAKFGVYYVLTYELDAQGKRVGLRSREISIMHLQGRASMMELMETVHCDTLGGELIAEPRAYRACVSLLPRAEWLSGDTLSAVLDRALKQKGHIEDVRAARDEAKAAADSAQTATESAILDR